MTKTFSVIATMGSTLDVSLHVKYIQSLGEVRYPTLDSAIIAFKSNALRFAQNKDDLVYHLTAHLQMNAVYWGLTALCVMGHKEALDRDEMIDFVMSCWDDEAG